MFGGRGEAGGGYSLLSTQWQQVQRKHVWKHTWSREKGEGTRHKQGRPSTLLTESNLAGPFHSSSGRLRVMWTLRITRRGVGSSTQEVTEEWGHSVRNTQAKAQGANQGWGREWQNTHTRTARAYVSAPPMGQLMRNAGLRFQSSFKWQPWAVLPFAHRPAAVLYLAHTKNPTTTAHTSQVSTGKTTDHTKSHVIPPPPQDTHTATARHLNPRTVWAPAPAH
jgi:hypothetical protein